MLADIGADSPPIRDAWCELVRHLLAAGEGEPSKKWERDLQGRLDAVGRPVFLGRALGWIALGPMPGEPTTPQVPERDAHYLKGFVCALGALEDTSIATALADLAVQCLTKVPNHGPIAARVGNACIRALARLPGTAAVAQLGRLRTRVRLRGRPAARRDGVDRGRRTCGCHARGVGRDRAAHVRSRLHGHTAARNRGLRLAGSDHRYGRRRVVVGVLGRSCAEECAGRRSERPFGGTGAPQEDDQGGHDAPCRPAGPHRTIARIRSRIPLDLSGASAIRNIR